jgi:hypothetical protein
MSEKPLTRSGTPPGDTAIYHPGAVLHVTASPSEASIRMAHGSTASSGPETGPPRSHPPWWATTSAMAASRLVLCSGRHAAASDDRGEFPRSGCA